MNVLVKSGKPNKYQARKYLKGLLGWCVPSKQHGDFLVVDTAIIFNSFFENAVKVETYSDIFLRIRYMAERLLRMDIRGVIFLVDRQALVPDTKNEEQLRRNKERAVPDCVAGQHYPLDELEFRFDTPFPYDYKLMLGDRSGWRQKFFRWIFWNLLLGPERLVLPPNKKKFMAVYGHAITLDYMLRRQEEVSKYLQADEFFRFLQNEFNNDDLEDYMLAIASYPGENDTICANQRARHGEADLQGFYLASRIIEESHEFEEDDRMSIVEFVSTDTDWLFMCLLFLMTNYEVFEDADKVYLRPTGFLQNVYLSYTKKFAAYVCHLKGEPRFHDPDEGPDGTERVNMLDLAGKLAGLRKFRYPAHTLMIAYMLAGSDCTEAYWRIDHPKVLAALFKYSDFVGDLFLPPNRIDHDAYKRLLLVSWKDTVPAYSLAHPSQMTIDGLRNYLRNPPRKGKAEGKPVDPKKIPDANSTIELRILQAEAYFTICLHLNSDSVSPMDLTNYGYYHDDQLNLWLRRKI